MYFCDIFRFNFSESGGDLNSELSRVVTELESAIHERKANSGEQVKGSFIDEIEDDDVEEKALEVSKEVFEVVN